MDPFTEKMVQQVRTSPPSCLGGLRVTPHLASTWDGRARWSLACSCGSTKGSVLGYPLHSCNPGYVGPPSYVGPLAFACAACGKATELLDTRLHGYNAEIGKLEGGSGDSNYFGTGQRDRVPCPSCRQTEFSMDVYVSHPDFDLIEDEPVLGPRAQEFFQWFDCQGKCAACGATCSLADFEVA